MEPVYQGKLVSKAINHIFKELHNEDIKGNTEKQLFVWDKIFKRILQPDGVWFLHNRDEIRYHMKNRAIEALSYREYSVSKSVELVSKSAELVLDVIEKFEYLKTGLDDITVGMDNIQIESDDIIVGMGNIKL